MYIYIYIYTYIYIYNICIYAYIYSKQLFTQKEKLNLKNTTIPYWIYIEY